MQILSIQLKNIKSHREAEFSFSPGINVLSGPNGVGKSTVFEAIGYALFGVDARDFVSNIDRFLSIGAKRGEVAVTFIAADGETYRVTRTVGTPSTWRLAKRSGDLFETEDHAGAAETEERIRELLGLAKGRSLADQFKLVIGPFQSEFLGPFVLKQPTKRREAFDEILGIDSWRKTFDGTKELGSIIKGKIATLETEIAGKCERVAALPERRAELEAVLREEAEKAQELKGVAAELTMIAALLGTLEEKRTSIERLRAEIIQADASILSGKEHVGSQTVLVKEAEAAVRTVAETKAGKGRYDAAERTLVELREREKTRQRLEKEVADLESQIASALQSARHEEGEAAVQEQAITSGRAEIDAAGKELQERLAKILEEETTLLSEQERLRQIDGHFRNLALGKIDSLLPYVRVTLNRIMEIDAIIHDRKTVLLDEGAWRERAATLDELRKKREELLAERARLVGKLAGLSEGEEKLQEGFCPFLGERCRNLEEAGSAAAFPERKGELQREIDEAAKAVAVLDEAVAGAEAAVSEIEKFRAIRIEIESLEKERARLAAEREANLGNLDPAGVAAQFEQWAREHQLDDCRSEGERLIGGSISGSPAEQLVALEEWERKCHHVATSVEAFLARLASGADAPLTALKADRARVDARLGELERRRQEFAEAERLLAERRKKAALHRERAAKLEHEALAKKEQAVAFAGVDAAIQEADEERRRSQSDHERFLQAEPLASDVGRRTEILERYLKRLEQLELERKAKAGELAAISATYSQEDHAERQRQKEALHSREAALTENLRNLNQNRQRLHHEIEELQKIEEEMKKKHEEVRDLRRKEELVKFLRMKVFKNVSAQLSERFREEITLRADRIYRTIAESDEELVWGEDYRIILRDMTNGTIRERTDDQLSGGQTMSAVVALRLALLQTIGARLAFFDEPTSNLDAARRENLAQAFRAIDHGKEEVTEHWYDQLFLISHDVAFTEVTDQVIPLGE